MKKVFFDLETTSAKKDECRIIQVGITQLDEKGNVLISKSKMYKPDVPITPEATAAHGITDEMVKDCPSFYDDCKKLKKIFEDAVLVGYNIIVFDIPVLMSEFDRAGVELNLSGHFIDVMKLETILQPRTLSAVYERYTGEKLESAHDALADVRGTRKVFGHQLAKIDRDGLNKDEILKSCGVPEGAADFFGKLKCDDQGYLVFNFGKKALGKRVVDEVQYANWVLGEAFPSQVKNLIKEELKRGTKQAFTHPHPHTAIKNFDAPNDIPF